MTGTTTTTELIPIEEMIPNRGNTLLFTREGIDGRIVRVRSRSRSMDDLDLTRNRTRSLSRDHFRNGTTDNYYFFDNEELSAETDKEVKLLLEVMNMDHCFNSDVSHNNTDSNTETEINSYSESREDIEKIITESIRGDG